MKQAELHQGIAIAREGVKIAYQFSGVGPALVCCHAMGWDHTMWNPQRAEFSRSHQFITFDQRGSGNSEHPPFESIAGSLYTVESFGDDLRAVLDELGIEKARILGFSMGAVAALSFATRWPERVERLVLVSAMASRLPEDIIARARLVEEVVDTDGIVKAYEFYFSGPLFEGLGKGDSFRRQLEGVVAKATPHGFKGCFRVTIDRPSLLEKLQVINAPTLVVVGERDKHYLTEADRMSEKLPNAKKIIIANAGHPITMQQPDAFEREVLSFLS